MAACRIVNESVSTAVGTIETISNSYRSAGEELISALGNAISEMQGEAKDAFKKLIDTKVKTFVAEDLPNAIMSMSQLLEQNRQKFEEVDREIASSISSD